MGVNARCSNNYGLLGVGLFCVRFRPIDEFLELLEGKSIFRLFLQHFGDYLPQIWLKYFLHEIHAGEPLNVKREHFGLLPQMALVEYLQEDQAQGPHLCLLSVQTALLYHLRTPIVLIASCEIAFTALLSDVLLQEKGQQSPPFSHLYNPPWIKKSSAQLLLVQFYEQDSKFCHQLKLNSLLGQVDSLSVSREQVIESKFPIIINDGVVITDPNLEEEEHLCTGEDAGVELLFEIVVDDIDTDTRLNFIQLDLRFGALILQFPQLLLAYSLYFFDKGVTFDFGPFGEFRQNEFPGHKSGQHDNIY